MGTGTSKHSGHGSGAWLRNDGLRTFRRVLKSSQPDGSRPSVVALAAALAVAAVMASLPAHAAENAASSQLPLPSKTGQVSLLEDFDNKVTKNDLGSDYFGGNTGVTESPGGVTQISVVNESAGASLRIAFDFTGQLMEGPFAGTFFSLFGLTDTKVELDGTGHEPDSTHRFPDYYLDTMDFYRGFLPWPGHRIGLLRFDIQREYSKRVVAKIELKDENDVIVFTRRAIDSDGWQTLSLHLPEDFSSDGPAAFDWRRVSVLSLIIERENVGAGVYNPTTGAIRIDNLAVVDVDGEYPDLDAARSEPEQYSHSFLEYVRATSFLYFLDFASTDPRTGGIIQDRSAFADLMTVGGVGFQLTAYAIGAARGYISREDAANRTLAILTHLHDAPQGPARVGTAGHHGFFYHFLGVDGLRKQNFDFLATPQDESKNTVEISTIDTALAVAGVLTVRQYFNNPNDSTEATIRSLADAIYERVDWPFMLEAHTNQFYLAWKPDEEHTGDPFQIADGTGEGQYSGTPGNPATLGFYTDEAVLVSLLAIASPTHPVSPSVFFATQREGTPFVKTYPGALFTYQFGSVWLDTAALGPDAHGMDYFANTTAAVLATRQYALDNPEDRTTWRDGGGATRWGLSATEGPFDAYFAEAARTAALATGGECIGNAGSAPRPLELGTVTVYGVGSSIVHAPDEAVAALWESQRLGLLHPRFGFADAFSLDVSDAVVPGCIDPTGPGVLRASGPWANRTGFAIDQGPMLVLIDNYLEDEFAARLFMSHPRVREALQAVFPISCVGDCNLDHEVTINELITMVNIALGITPLTTCTQGDPNRDLEITIDEILSAVNNALYGCPAGPSLSPTPTETPVTKPDPGARTALAFATV